ncbi:TPA: hypothetical protein I7676_21010 [Vibrio vulnificus]|nr:hypothetical protein [Vibrio cholerae]MCU8247150.1 hypothetical protein [Vibrio vulnificus]HAS8138103.1 hypothetical protein [Vibrio vulnificus]HAS8219169.1 hypothetical protein [Vibrio vulnificus]HAS8299781.1 hypothetical protein [Vibrio vulnificus]
MSLSWKTLHSLYNSIIGKSVLIVSLATPVALMYNATSFIPSQFPWVLLGALIALVGYVFVEVFTPELVKDFKNAHHYSSSLIEISANVDWVSEFKILEENVSTLKSDVDGYSVKPYEFKTIEATKKFIGEDRAIRSLALIKFNHVNLSGVWKRRILTASFYMSIILIFSSTILHIKTILIG